MMSAERSLNAAASFVALAIGAFLALPAPAAAQTTWPPILMDDAAMKDCPQQPGAPAVILYREELTDVKKGTTTVFKRLKILTAAGRDRSNIEIPFVSGYTKVTGIEARVVPSKGPEREFSGQIFEKTAMRYRKLRMAVKTFALPDVDVGSIIDYRYKIEIDLSSSSAKGLDDIMTGLIGYEGRPEEGGFAERTHLRALPAESWQVQEDLFTKKAKFSYTNEELWIEFMFMGGCRLAWASVGMKEGTPTIGRGKAGLEMSNIPAFDAEEFMIPEEMLKMSVDIFYLDSEIKDTEEFWKLESTDWQKGVEKFIGKPGKLAGTVRGIIGDATEPVEQLRRIYAKVQGLRNLSYEKGLTRKQRKEQKIKDNSRVADVLERGFGLRSDLTRTFVALAKAAGFTAEVVRVTARDDKLYRKDFLSFYSQLDSEVAVVEVGDRTMIFDPATPFCPFGLAHWSRTNSTALRFSDKPPAFFTTPIFPPEMALTQREIALGLDLQGNLAGTVKTTYTGQEALVRRLEYLHDDDTVRKAALEKELTDVLPIGASATLTKVDNFDNNDPALIALYDVSIPGIATVAGEKMLLPVSPLVGSGQYPFRTTARKYPVYFPYPFRDFDDIVITLPEGLTAEVRPAPRKDQNDFSAYSLVCSDEGPGKIHVQRDFVIKKIFFPVERYGAVKTLFDSVRASDEAQVIFTTRK